jgi:hypothetical protein
MIPKIAKFVLIVALLIISLMVATQFAEQAHGATLGGFPVQLSISASATPGTIKPGSKVTFTVTVRGTGKVLVGIPGPDAPMNPSHALARPADDLSIWNVGQLRKGVSQKLTFSLIAQPPSEVEGAAMWCIAAVSGPRLNQNPVAWWTQAEICYGVQIP